MNIKELNIGIIHTAYLKRGGEDQVADSEYQLLKDNGFNVFFLKFENPGSRLKQLLTFTISAFNIGSFIKCYKWIKKNNINVLHVHNWFFAASPSVFWAARLCNVPVILTMHNYRMLCPSGTLIYNGKPYVTSIQTEFSWDAIRKGVYRSSPILTFILAFTVWFNKKIGTWKHINKYIILTDHSEVVIKSSHLRTLVGKLVTKPNFVQSSKAIPLSAVKDNFLFVGRLSEEKGIHLLLSAFKGTSHKLTIIGEGPLQSEVEDFVKDNSNVTYLGYQSKDVVNTELSKCTALIFPSIWYETFGLIMIEAFALSTPVIASYFGSASIIIKDGYNGLHFDASDPNNLTAKLNQWVALDEHIKQQYRENAYSSYLQHYTPEKNLEQLAKIYQGVIQ